LSILELSTQEPERPVIRIDNTDYHLSAQEDLSLKQSSYMSWAGKQIDKIVNADDWSEEQGDKLEGFLDDACKLALYDVPGDVYEKLTDGHKIKVIQAFSEAVLGAGDSEQQNSTE
jgi:hypothetical protein